MIPYVYLRELIDNRVRPSIKGEVTYIEDDLFNQWRDQNLAAGLYSAVEVGEPNLLYKGRVIRPEWSRPTAPEKPKCCCRCKGCC